MGRASGVLLVAALGIAAPRAVVAQEFDDEESGPKRSRVEAAVGLVFGSHGVDDYVGEHTGGAFDLGVRHGRWFGYGEYALFFHHGEIGDVTISGLFHRASANARYDLKQLWFGDEGVLSAWLEAGVGYGLVRWEDGGKLGRPDASIGLGGGIQVGEAASRIGIGYSIKLLFAPAPERKGETMSCAGPCYEATGPLGVDVGALFSILFPFEV